MSDPVTRGEPYRMERQVGCARCGADEHFDLLFEPLTFPMVDLVDGMTGTHWCPCPVNGEPIILFVGPAPEADEPPPLLGLDAEDYA